MQEKQQLRAWCRTVPAPQPAESQAVCAEILRLPAYAAARGVMAFYPMPDEVDVRPVLEDCLRQGKRLYLPQTDGQMQIHPRRVSALSQLQQGKFGIWEPPETLPEETAYDLILVPAMAYDRAGFRLGRGAGCYDRFLPGFAGVTVGVCLERFLLEQIPREPHDFRVQWICTEQQTLNLVGR